MRRRDFLAALLAVGVGPDLAERLAHRKLFAPLGGWPESKVLIPRLNHWSEVTFILQEVELESAIGKAARSEAEGALARFCAEEINQRAGLLTQREVRAVADLAKGRQRFHTRYDPAYGRGLIVCTVDTMYGFPPGR